MPMLPSGLPDVVSDEEDLARFLVSSRWYNSKGAKPAAFLPNPKDWETSVFRHNGDPRDELWSLFTDHVRGPSLHGAGIVKAHDVKSAELEVVASEPPPKHAAIRGWPWIANDPALQKAQQKERALLVAGKAVLLLKMPTEADER
jgi:hypothetical protein